MVGMRALEPDCERDPASTQGRTKSSTHCLSELTMLLEFSDGRTSSTRVLLMTYFAVSSSSTSPFQKNSNAAVASSRAPLGKPIGRSISGARGVKLTLYVNRWNRVRNQTSKHVSLNIVCSAMPLTTHEVSAGRAHDADPRAHQDVRGATTTSTLMSHTWTCTPSSSMWTSSGQYPTGTPPNEESGPLANNTPLTL